MTQGPDLPSRAELARRVGDLNAVGGVRQVVLADGLERGIRALEFRTGSGLCFDVLVDRAMDIGPAEHKGRAFGWRSATGFRNPQLHEHNDEGGLSWLRSFSGLFLTAGLDHTLFMATVDASNYDYPPRATVSHGIHGRIANVPARLTGYGEQWEGDRCILWAEGEVRQAAVFAENLVMRRRIEADLGGDEIRLLDTVTNAGFDPAPHMFLYHINVGWPLLDEGTRFVAPIELTRWCTESVWDQRVSYQRMPAPQPEFVEQVYEHVLASDAEGRVPVVVANERRGFGLEVAWEAKAFPRFFEWMHVREGAYALGVEPSTHHVEGDQAAREDGSMIWLQHGQSRTYSTTFRVLDGQEDLQEAVGAVRAIAEQPDEDVPLERSK